MMAHHIPEPGSHVTEDDPPPSFKSQQDAIQFLEACFGKRHHTIAVEDLPTCNGRTVQRMQDAASRLPAFASPTTDPSIVTHWKWLIHCVEIMHERIITHTLGAQ